LPLPHWTNGSQPERDSTLAKTEIKINIGCGVSGVPGWVNLDNSPTILLSRLPLLKRWLAIPAWPRDVLRRDVRRGLPFPDDSVSYIYSSHTFEHFAFDESLALGKECFRVLKEGGILRVVVPDLALVVKEYLADPSDLASHRFLDRLSIRQSLRDIVHPGSHHSQMLDARSLTCLLRRAGFAEPEVSSFRQSAMPDIEAIELDIRKRESLYVEARKTS